MARTARLSSRVDVIVFAGCLLLSLVTLVLPLQMREPLADSLRRTVVAPLVSLQSGAERWRTAWLQSEQRTVTSDSVALRAFRSTGLESENEQLRRLLGLGSRLQSGFVPAEAVHNAVSEDVVTTLTLTAGSNAGVRTYSPVVAPEGVVGLVQTVDPTISIAILFSHPDFRASAMSADSSAFGIVHPHLGARDGRYLLELRGVPFRATLKRGAAIYTSGLGGTFPRGIPIGTVINEVQGAEGWTRTYLVQPAVNPARVGTVMILLPPRVAAGVRNVWAMISNVDSAARAVAAAADSITRQRQLDSARRVAMDSASRAAADSARADSARRGIVVSPPPGTTPAAAPPAQPATRPTVTTPTPRPPGAAAATAPATRDSLHPRPRPRRDSTLTARPPRAPGDTSARMRRDSIGRVRRDTTRPDTTRLTSR